MKKKIILSFAFLSLMFLACSKQQDTESGLEGYECTDSNPDSFWDKQPGGILLDTAWDSDTTLCF